MIELYFGARTSGGGFFDLNFLFKAFHSLNSRSAIISSIFHSLIDFGRVFSQMSKLNGFGTVIPFYFYLGCQCLA